MALRANLRVEVTASSVRETPQRLFPWQADDERIEHIFRRHWWSAFRWMWLPVLIGAGVALGGVALIAVSGWLGVLVIGIGIAIPLLIGIYFYYEWQDDCLVITDQRLIRIQEMIFRFEKAIKEIPLPRVLEVSTSLPPVDPFARFFSYGTLEIKTSGTSGTLVLEQMPNPQQVQQAIFKQRDLQQRINTERAREQVAYDVQAALGGTPKQSTEPTPASAAFDMRRQDRPALLTTRLVADNGDIIYRKHITIWLRQVLPPLMVSLGGLIAAFIGVTAFALPEAQVVLIVAGVLALLIGAFWLYLSDWDWRNDLLVIGEDSIQIIHKRPLWLQNQNDTIRIDQIDNVLTDVTGIFDTIFKRGTIRISLLGSSISDAKIFENISKPEIVQGEISRRQTQLTQQRELDEAQRQRALLRDYLSAYHQISGQEAGDTTAPPSPPSQRSQHQSPAPLSPNTNAGTDLPPTSRDAMRPPRIPRIRPDSEK